MAVLWASCSAHLLPVGLNSVMLAQRRVSPVQRSILDFCSAVCLHGGQVGSALRWCSVGVVRDGAGSWGSDASELVPEAGRQDALHLLHDEVQRSKQRAEELQQRRKTQSYTNPETLQELLDRLSNISIRICTKKKKSMLILFFVEMLLSKICRNAGLFHGTFVRKMDQWFELIKTRLNRIVSANDKLLILLVSLVWWC